MQRRAKSTEEYFVHSAPFEADVRQLDALIRKHAPHLKQHFFNGLGKSTGIGYGTVEYQGKSMKEPAEWPLVGMVAQKNYVAIYVCAVIDGEYFAESNKDRLGKVGVGKSCIRIKKYEHLNEKTFGSMLEELDKRYVAGEKLFNV